MESVCGGSESLRIFQHGLDVLQRRREYQSDQFGLFQALVVRQAGQTDQGNLWKWIVVDYQGNEVIPLPFRPKGVEQEEDMGGVIMMLGKDEFMGRKDRRLFAAVSPKKLLSLTVDLKDGKKE